MAGSLPSFLTRRPGIDQGRIDDPSGWLPPEGTAALVLGSDTPGHVRGFVIGDQIDVFQSATVSPGKILRLASRTRGPARMPAVTGAEPFVLSDGMTLNIRIDGGTLQVVTFSTGQFAAIAAATATEVRDAIASQLTGAVAELTGTDELQILSNRVGRGSRVEIVGGTSVAALGIAELAWMGKIRINAVEILSFQLRPGETRDLGDLGANLAAHGDPAAVRFRLELVAL